MCENNERNTGPSDWLINRRHEREKIMKQANTPFDTSPAQPADSGDEGDEKNEILIIESDDSNDSSSDSASESSDNDVIAIEESEEEESDKADSDGFEIIESKSTVKPPVAKSDDDQPEIICLSDALSSDTDIGAEKLAKKAKKKEKKRAKKELKKMKRKKNARKLSNVSDEWVERMKKRRESMGGAIGPALPTWAPHWAFCIHWCWNYKFEIFLEITEKPKWARGDLHRLLEKGTRHWESRRGRQLCRAHARWETHPA